MVRCETCGKEFKTAQGLAEHMRYKHGDSVAGASAAPATRIATEQQLGELEGRLEQVENINELESEHWVSRRAVCMEFLSYTLH